MTFWHENACRVTWVLWWESTSHQWIPSQRASNVCFDVFVDVILNKRFSKYSIYRWFETTWCLLRRHYNDIITQIARFMGSTWGPPGSCRPQMGPMLAPWTLSSEHYQAPIYQINSPSPTNAYMHQDTKPSLVQTIERFRNPTITEQPHVTSSLTVFVNAKPEKSSFEKRVRLVKFFTSEWEIIGVETQLNKSI